MAFFKIGKGAGGPVDGATGGSVCRGGGLLVGERVEAGDTFCGTLGDTKPAPGLDVPADAGELPLAVAAVVAVVAVPPPAVGLPVAPPLLGVPAWVGGLSPAVCTPGRWTCSSATGTAVVGAPHILVVDPMA